MKNEKRKIINERKSGKHIYRIGRFMCFCGFLFSWAFHPLSVSAENDGFSGKRAFELLQRQCSFGPRVPGSPASAACANFIEHELKEIGLTVKRQNFRVYSQLMKSDVTGTNIIGLYSGDSPSTDLVALSAHWDSRPVADRDADAQLRFQPIIGANDGASGVAVLIEIARVISKRRYPGRIIFLFFDLEDAGLPGSLEQWCLGSTYFAEHSLHDYPITMGVNFDMIGDRNLRIQPEQMMMKHAPELTRDFWRSAQKSAPRYFIDEPLPYVIHDDHEPFLRRGIPYIDLIDFDYPEWHTQEDTPDACSPWSLEIVGKAAIDFVFHRMEKFKK